MYEYQKNLFQYNNNFKLIENIDFIPIIDNRSLEAPRMTIGIPTFNRATLLKESLESAINQNTDSDYDILIIDNNPQRGDETEFLLQNYKGVKGLRYIKNVINVGMCSNWNRLYQLSRTEYTIMLHDDDLINENFIDYHSKIINTFPSWELIFPSYSILNKDNKGINSKSGYYKIETSDFFLNNMFGAPLGLIAKTERILKLGGFDPNSFPGIDVDLYYRAVQSNLQCYKIEGTSMARYRFEVNSAIQPDIIRKFIKVREAIWSIFLEKSNHLNRIFLQQVIEFYRSIYIRTMMKPCKEEIPDLIQKLAEYERKRSLFSSLSYRIYCRLNKYRFKIRFKRLPSLIS